MKIKEWKILSYYFEPNGLEEEVNKAIKAGWQPYGEINVAITAYGVSEKEYKTPLVYTQIMVKYEQE